MDGSKKEMKVIVIGGGASGLVSAIVAKRNGHEVIILERNEVLGKKILLTGNGRCNYWNELQGEKYYHSSNEEQLHRFFSLSNLDEVSSFFSSIGIVPKKKNGCYYPSSNQSSTIRDALEAEVKHLKIEVVLSTFVEKIEKQKEKFIVTTENKSYVSDAIILATGSKAYPKTGSDGNGYLLAESLGHTIIPVLPSLASLKGRDTFYSKWNGVRTDATLTLVEDGEVVKQETGEIQLTDYGISGICTFNLSGRVLKGLEQGRKEEIRINFLPWLEENTYLWLEERNEQLKGRTIRELLEGVLNKKLVAVLLKCASLGEGNKYFSRLSIAEKRELAHVLESFSFFPVGNGSTSFQVCSGGVSLSEVSVSTMESKLVSRLYFTGELLDVDGDCGGYNLGFSWLSGLIAGRLK